MKGSESLVHSSFPFILLVDCGSPAFPPTTNATVGAVASTAEGATVTFQCADGLIPPDPMNITCIRINNMGQWTPDPAEVQCHEGTIGHTQCC